MPKSYETRTFHLSVEQQRFIDTAKTGCNILVDACIGSGKTTVLQTLCNVLPESRRILYLTYNRLLKIDAKSKIKNPNVVVTNYHGFAAMMLHSMGIKVAVADLIQTFIREKPTIKPYDLLLIDEYQDIEQELAEMLTYIKACNPQMQIIAVGDMQQKIYDKTELEVESFINQFLGDHISLEFTECFRLSANLADMLGRVWHKKIVGTNSSCCVETMSLEQAVDFLSKQPVKDILCLGQRGNGDLTDALNILEEKYPEKFNKNTIYASIRDQDSGQVVPGDSSAIFTTYDSSKGLERKICVIFNFTEDYWRQRLDKPQQSYEILRNVFCVACSRGKEHIIFVDSGKAMLSEESLSTADQNNEIGSSFDISDMFDYKYIENVNACYNLLDIQPIMTEDCSQIDIPKHDALIDLSPCVGKYQEAIFFEDHNIDKEIELYCELHKSQKGQFTKDVRNLSVEEKILFAASLETGQKRYRKQVKIPFVTPEAKQELCQRLHTYLSPDENVQVPCEIDFAEKEKGIKAFSAKGLADVVKDGVVYELKFVSELAHTHFLQCACYVVAMGLEKGILWNTFNNEMYEIKVPDRTAFLDAVTTAITKKKYLKYYEPADRELSIDAPVVSCPIEKMRSQSFTNSSKNDNTINVAVIDTETNWSDRVMSIGLVIADALEFRKIAESYYILDPEYSVGGMYSHVLEMHTGEGAITCSRGKAIEEIREFLTKYHVSQLFAYNASFDRRHLPELNDFTWYDIMKIAAYKQYNPYIPDDAECNATGRLRRNGGVEPMLRLLLHDNGYCETHNALCDAQDELKIMQLLGMPVEKYECAVLRNCAEQQKREKTVFVPAAQSHKDTSTKNCDGIEKKAVRKHSADGNDSFGEVYTADEVAQMLHISRNQVYQLIHGGKIQAYKEKNRFCICKHSVEQYMEEKEREYKIEKRRNFYAWAFSVLVGTIALLFFFSRM